MRYFFIGIAVIVLFLGSTIENMPLEAKNEPIEAVLPVSEDVPMPVLQRRIEQYIRSEASNAGIASIPLLITLRCESGFKPDAKGDSGRSLGVWQIHMPAHPTMTPACALNEICATQYALPLYKKSPHLWSCYPG